MWHRVSQTEKGKTPSQPVFDLENWGHEKVRERGVEPPRPEGHWHLKPARLPFRHSRMNPLGSDEKHYHAATRFPQIA